MLLPHEQSVDTFRGQQARARERSEEAELPPAPVRPVRRTGQTGVLGFAYFERSGG
jgi:hypothetical protein